MINIRDKIYFNCIEFNQGRFGYSDDLKQIFLNTLEILE